MHAVFRQINRNYMEKHDNACTRCMYNVYEMHVCDACVRCMHEMHVRDAFIMMIRGSSFVYNPCKQILCLINVLGINHGLSSIQLPPPPLPVRPG